jgi:hypothetical protein
MSSIVAPLSKPSALRGLDVSPAPLDLPGGCLALDNDVEDSLPVNGLDLSVDQGPRLLGRVLRGLDLSEDAD